MNYDTFKEKVESKMYEARKDNVDLFIQLTEVEYLPYWLRLLKREILKDRSLDNDNIIYMIENFFGKKKGQIFFNQILNEIKENITPLNFGITMNRDFFSIEEKIKIMKDHREEITIRHWQYFFGHLSYHGSKMLPEIKKHYNFENYNKMKSLNEAFISVLNKIDYQPYEDRKNKKEKEHILRINMQARLFIELAQLGLDPAAKIKKEIFYEDKLSSIGYIIHKRQVQLLNKILYLNAKEENQLVLKDEAASFAFRFANKGINRDTMYKLLTQTNPEYLLNDFKDFKHDKKNIEVILENILYSDSYHEKNIKLLFKMLSVSNSFDTLDKRNIRLNFFEKFKDSKWLNNEQKEIIESIIAIDQKFVIQQSLEIKPIQKENKIRL